MKKYIGIIAVVALVAGGFMVLGKDRGVSPLDTSATAANAIQNTIIMPESKTKVKIETSQGDIIVQMYDTDAPKAVNNFVTLAGKGFYDNLIFHRVIPGFMIQGGDPKGVGTGGPGYQFEDELNPAAPSSQLGYQKGVLAMANAGPNTNGSQFFIMLEDYATAPRILPHLYTIFGKVIEGQNIVDAIGRVQTDPNDKPVTPVVIKKVSVLQ